MSGGWRKPQKEELHTLYCREMDGSCSRHSTVHT